MASWLRPFARTAQARFHPGQSPKLQCRSALLQYRRQHTTSLEQDAENDDFIDDIVEDEAEFAESTGQKPLRISRVPVGKDAAKADARSQAARHIRNRYSLRLAVDGRTYEFDPIFLRDSCRCIHCRDPDSGQKKFDTYDIPGNIRVREVYEDAEGNMTMRWNRDVQGYSEDHTTTIPKARLPLLVDGGKRTTHQKSVPWSSMDYRSVVKTFDYQAYMSETMTTYNVLLRLRKYGLAFLNNVPEDEKSVEHIGERIGPLRDTFYGRTWDVKDKPQAENVAYTSQHLGLHSDLLYMKKPPGLQLLHCIESSADGGLSIFSDAYRAAKAIENLSSRSFYDLATFPVAYAYTKNGNYYHDEKPVFELAPYVRPTFPPEPLYQRLRAVNWSPPFQGDLRYNIGLGDDGVELRSWLRAAKAFREILSGPDNAIEYKLKPGECVIFNNRRVLHGRTAFQGIGSADAKPRWLKGAYVDTDAFQSAYSRYFGLVRERLAKGQRVGGDEETDMLFHNLARLKGHFGRHMR